MVGGGVEKRIVCTAHTLRGGSLAHFWHPTLVNPLIRHRRSFLLIVFFCLLNMIMAIIMGAYDEAARPASECKP